MQEVLLADEKYMVLNQYIKRNGIQSVFLVCDGAYGFLNIKRYFDKLEQDGLKIIKFSNFQPNPLYESVVEGVKLFQNSDADTIIAIGGGSAIDVAKCIKLYSNMNDSHNYLEQSIIANHVKLLAIPTTSGTGSEATRYAVIYYKGEKQSITDLSIIPDTVLFDSSALKTLSLYQRKATMMDAYCHAIESFWSVNSTDESKKFSREAIKAILSNMDGYLNNEDKANANMLRASHVAGQAINITQTTAGHAMCYKLTSLYGIAHGHAAALVNVKLFPYMIKNTQLCIDPRGEEYLKQVFSEIAIAMGCTSSEEASQRLQNMFDKLGLSIPDSKKEDYEILKNSVNQTRLKNNPVRINRDSLDLIYHKILDKESSNSDV